MSAPPLSASANSKRTSSVSSSGLWSHPKQKVLLLLGFGAAIGSFLPWLETPLGTFRGFAGPGQYVFYAGVIGIAAGLVPIRSLAIIQGTVLAAVALILPIWQATKLLLAVGLNGWVPGIGMVLIFGCGVMAARATTAIARPGTR